MFGGYRQYRDYKKNQAVLQEYGGRAFLQNVSNTQKTGSTFAWNQIKSVLRKMQEVMLLSNYGNLWRLCPVRISETVTAISM
jgi:putative IMPACT (imprinted ancient) family translation regulator